MGPAGFPGDGEPRQPDPPPPWAVPDPAFSSQAESGAGAPGQGGYPPPWTYGPPGTPPYDPSAPPWQSPASAQPPPPLQGQPPPYLPPPPGYPPAEFAPGAGPRYGAYAPPGSPGSPGSPPPPGGYGNYPYGSYPQPYGWHYGAPPAPARVRTPEERRRRRRHGITYGAALVVLAGIGIGLGFWLAPTPPATVAEGLTKQAVAAGNAAGSFHYVQRSTEDSVRDVIVGDAGTDGGQQLITQQGGSGTNIYRLRLVHGVVYFRGNKAAVIDQLGVSQAKASADVGKWVSIHKGDGPYASFAAGITTKSNLSQLPETFVPLTSTTTSSSSPPTTRISGGLTAGKGRPAVGTARLVVATSSTLPRSFAAKATAITGVHLLLAWRFSHWGAPVHVSAPSGAVPYSSLGATTPPANR